MSTDHEERHARRARITERLDNDLRTKEHAKAAVSNAAYQAVVALFERAERRHLVRGNGHHMAQAVGEAAAALMGERWTGEEQRSNHEKS